MLQRLLLCSAFLMLAGCGISSNPADSKSLRYSVKVTVMLDGKPLPNGRVVFQGSDAQAPAQGEVKDGETEFHSSAGKCRVEIFAFRQVPRYREPQEFLPKRFNKESKMSVDVAPNAANTFTFKVTSK